MFFTNYVSLSNYTFEKLSQRIILLHHFLEINILKWSTQEGCYPLFELFYPRFYSFYFVSEHYLGTVCLLFLLFHHGTREKMHLANHKIYEHIECMEVWCACMHKLSVHLCLPNQKILVAICSERNGNRNWTSNKEDQPKWIFFVT